MSGHYLAVLIPEKGTLSAVLPVLPNDSPTIRLT
jgi:hypothetical protein